MNAPAMTLSDRGLIDLGYDFDDDGSSMSGRLPESNKPWGVLSKARTAETGLATESDGATGWFADALANVIRLRQVSADWHSSGATPPNESAIQTTITILRQLADFDLCPNRIAPSSDEGVCISFESAGRYADIESFNNGETLAMISPLGGTPRIWSVQDRNLQESIAKILQFIAD